MLALAAVKLQQLCLFRNKILIINEIMHLEQTHTNSISPPTCDNVTGLILAGGRGSRFNDQDKGLISYKGSTLAEHAIARLAPQVKTILLSVNRNLDYYNSLNVTCIQDSFSDYPGPLAGIHSALKIIQTEWLVTIACDTPCFPLDYVEKLSSALHDKKSLVAVVRNENRLQNVFMLIHKNLFASLDTFLKNGERKAQIWLEQNNPCIVDFTQQRAFSNINTLEDLTNIEALHCDE